MWWNLGGSWEHRNFSAPTKKGSRNREHVALRVINLREDNLESKNRASGKEKWTIDAKTTSNNPLSISLLVWLSWLNFNLLHFSGTAHWHIVHFFYQETQMGRNWNKFIQIWHCVLLYCLGTMISFIWHQITYHMMVGKNYLHFNNDAHWQIVHTFFIQETNSSKSATVSCYTAWALCSLLYGIIPFSGRSLVGVLQDPRCSLSFPHFIFPTPAIRIKVNSV